MTRFRLFRPDPPRDPYPTRWERLARVVAGAFLIVTLAYLAGYAIVRWIT